MLEKVGWVGWGAGGGRVHTHMQFHASGSGLAVALLALHALHPHGLAFYLLALLFYNTSVTTAHHTRDGSSTGGSCRRAEDTGCQCIYLPRYLVKHHHEEADKGRGRPHPDAEENRTSATLTEWELPGQIATTRQYCEPYDSCMRSTRIGCIQKGLQRSTPLNRGRQRELHEL